MGGEPPNRRSLTEWGDGEWICSNTYWKNHATAKVMKAESFCCSELGFPKQLKVWVICLAVLVGWTADSFQCLWKAKQWSPHSTLTMKYFGHISVPSFCQGCLSLYFDFLVSLSSPSALVPHLLLLTCWLIQLQNWRKLNNSSPCGGFWWKPQSKAFSCHCWEEDWSISISFFDAGITVGQCMAYVPQWNRSRFSTSFQLWPLWGLFPKLAGSGKSFAYQTMLFLSCLFCNV